MENYVQCWPSLGREFAVENKDFPLLLLVVGGRRQLLSLAFHENAPHHVFSPQIDGVVNVTVFVLVRIPVETV